MQVISNFDEFVLEKLEKVTHWIEKIMGVNCFQMTRFFLLCKLCLVIWNLLIADQHTHTAETLFGRFLHGFVVFVLLAISVVWAILLFAISIYLEHKMSKGDVLIRNPLKDSMLMMVVRVLAVTVDQIFIFNMSMGSLLYTEANALTLLLIACDPLPPGTKSKLSELVEHLSFKPLPAAG